MKILLAIFIGLLGYYGVVLGAEEGGHGITPTQIKNLIWWTVNFLLLLLILYKVLRKPLLNFLQSRREKIEQEYEELIRKKREAEAQYIELQEKLKNMEEEAKRILQVYLEQGQKEKERIIAEAELQAKRLKEQAELYIKHQIEKAKEDLRKEMALEVINLVEEKMRKMLNYEDQLRIVRGVISELKQIKFQ